MSPCWVDSEISTITGIAKKIVSHRPPGRISRYGTAAARKRRTRSARDHRLEDRVEGGPVLRRDRHVVLQPRVVRGGQPDQRAAGDLLERRLLAARGLRRVGLDDALYRG